MNELNLIDIAKNVKGDVSIDQSIHSFLFFSANRERMMESAIKETEDLRRSRTESVEQDLKERKEKLDVDIADIEKRRMSTIS